MFNVSHLPFTLQFTLPFLYILFAGFVTSCESQGLAVRILPADSHRKTIWPCVNMVGFQFLNMYPGVKTRKVAFRKYMFACFTISVQVKSRMLAAGQAFLPESLLHSLPALLAISLTPNCPDSYCSPTVQCPGLNCPSCSCRNGVEVVETSFCSTVSRVLLCTLGFIVGVCFVISVQKIRSLFSHRTPIPEISGVPTAASIALRRRHIQLA